MDDATLVEEAVGGSVPAFSAIFERYEAEVHDAALALLRDRKAALEVVQSTIREASERLESLKQPDRLRVWLLAVARFHAAQRGVTEAGLDRQPTGADHIAERAQLAGLVWEATADLPLRERALFDLHLRHGLDGEDLADALGMSPGEVDELKAGLPNLEKGLAGYLITRRADGRCPDLPLVLRGWDGRFDPWIATHIASHVEGCRICRESAAGLPSPLALYASAPQAPLPGHPGGAAPPLTESSPATQATPPTEAAPPTQATPVPEARS